MSALSRDLQFLFLHFYRTDGMIFTKYCYLCSDSKKRFLYGTVFTHCRREADCRTDDSPLLPGEGSPCRTVSVVSGTPGLCTQPFVALPVWRIEGQLPSVPHPLLQAGPAGKNARRDALCRTAYVVASSRDGAAPPVAGASLAEF